jgi:hypothetical protein
VGGQAVEFLAPPPMAECPGRDAQTIRGLVFCQTVADQLLLRGYRSPADRTFLLATRLLRPAASPATRVLRLFPARLDLW